MASEGTVRDPYATEEPLMMEAVCKSPNLEGGIRPVFHSEDGPDYPQAQVSRWTKESPQLLKAGAAAIFGAYPFASGTCRNFFHEPSAHFAGIPWSRQLVACG